VQPESGGNQDLPGTQDFERAAPGIHPLKTTTGCDGQCASVSANPSGKWSKIVQGFCRMADIYRVNAGTSAEPEIIPTMKRNKIIALSLAMGFASLSVPLVIADNTPANGKEEKTTAVKPYQLETCVVSGEKLGEMGKPVTFVYNGQEIKLCCKNCRKDFDKDPAKYLKKLEGK
jgi:hypothetical protein